MLLQCSTSFSREEQSMKQRVNGSIALGVLLAAVSLCGTANAGERVPFKGRSTAVVTTVGFDPVEGVVYTRVTGNGEATLLGHFSVVADAKVYLATGIVVGTWTLTAANGDMLIANLVGYGVDPTHGLGVFTIVAGTGRFLGATGSYQQNTTFDSPPGPSVRTYSDVLDGTISLLH
jgi:hypothetical protein